jgi:hypothetical protein
LRQLQRRRERDALYSIDAWDVELVADEQWGRVLVAQRDFAPGEVVIRSGMLLGAHSTAEFVRSCDATMQDAARFTQIIEWATSSPR